MLATLRSPSVPASRTVWRLAILIATVAGLQACGSDTPAQTTVTQTKCLLASDCPTGWACTGGICQAPGTAGGKCTTTAECGGNACVNGTCVAAGLGKCSCVVTDPCTKKTPSCGDGVSYADQDSGATPDVASTDPSADTGGPVIVPIGKPNPCADAKGCDDKDACTDDQCVAGVCVHPKKASAECTCFSTADCNDGNACTLDKCLNDQCSYAQYKDPKKPDALCCTSDADCVDGDRTGTCQQNRCLYPCKSDTDCALQDDKICTANLCLNGVCGLVPIPGCCDTNADCDDANTCTADACVAGQCTHTGQQGNGCCSTAADCDDKNDCTKDGCAAFQCTHTKADAACCKGPEDCSDGDLCTEDTCVAGKCKYTPKATCCKTDKECDDGKPCTADVCTGGSCQHSAQGKCCTANGDCNDGDDCTTDSCAAGVCQNTAKAGCVSTQCGDGNCDAPKETASNCPADCGGSNTGSALSCKGHCGTDTMLCSCSPGCDPAFDCCPDYTLVCGGSASGGGSCAGKCGGSVGSGASKCWCDASCASAGDCCGDYSTACGGSGATAKCGNGKCEAPAETSANCPSDCKAATGPSCQGKCGGSSGSGASKCYCDDVCSKAGDCCADFDSVCGGSSGAVCGASTATCKGKCGGVNKKAGCICDPDLCDYYPCCPDVISCCLAP